MVTPFDLRLDFGEEVHVLIRFIYRLIACCKYFDVCRCLTTTHPNP